MGEPIRFPTAEEFEAGWAQQLAEEHARSLRPGPRLMNEAEAELRAAGIQVGPPEPVSHRAGCPVCGRVFGPYRTLGMAKMHLGKHTKREHGAGDTVSVGVF